jgi:two-component system chemotaxis response regulator CheY
METKADKSDLSELRLLIVEDKDYGQALIERFLKNIGFNKFIWADDGEAALDLLKNETADLILSDRNMPHMNGVELFQNLQKNPKSKDIPFILITGDNKEENVIKAFKVGIRHYIVKPFTAQTLESKIREVLKLH